MLSGTSTLSQQAYDHIHKQLLRNELPVDRRVSEQAFANELGMSRAPVRDAIRRLSADGLLYQVPSKGTFVARPDRQHIIEIYEVRCALEKQAAAKAAKRMTHRERNELQRLLDQMRQAARDFRATSETVMSGEPLRVFLAVDMAFHLVILRAAGNRLAWKVIADGNTRSRVYGSVTHQRNLRHVATALLMHARIAQAVIRGDAAGASRWMARHIRASGVEALRAFDRRQAGTLPDQPAPPDLNRALAEVMQRMGMD